jgi:hypothetical protein
VECRFSAIFVHSKAISGPFHLSHKLIQILCAKFPRKVIDKFRFSPLLIRNSYLYTILNGVSVYPTHRFCLNSVWETSANLQFIVPVAISKTNLRGELYRPSDRRLSAKLVPTFADRGVAWSAQRIYTAVNIGFLDRSRYFSIQVAPQLSSRG